jgi:short-subunit dehydrogenase
VDYRGRIVVVTGASSGIGWEAARAFAARGAVVVAVARREERLQQLLEECKRDSPRSSYLAGDLAERDFAEGVIADTVARHGGLDVLVNNAAVSKHKQIYHLSADEAEYVTRVNYLSSVWTTLAAIPPMLQRGEGYIVNVSSFAAKVAPPREAVYAASKAALSLFTEGLWHDLAGSNIHAAIVVPGAIDTEIWDKEDEPVAYQGPKQPPAIVVDAIFEVIERRLHELAAPRRSLQLVAARLLRLFAPSLLRRGIARFEPVPGEVIERARLRAGEAEGRGRG